MSARLPLSPAGALELASALMAEDGALALERFTSLIDREPGLALWVAQRAYARQGACILTPAEAGRWLAEHGLEELAEWNPTGPLDHSDFESQTSVAEMLREVCTAGAASPGSCQRDHRAWPHEVFVPHAPGGSQAAGLAERTAELQERWSAAVDVSWVPSLVRRLARLELLEQSFQAELEAEKLAALKELAYGAGHEINNPLANIAARAQTLLEDERDPERRRRLAAIHAQAFRAHEMIADLMLFARPPQLQRVELNLGQCVQQVVASLRDQASAQNTELVYAPPSVPIALSADSTQISIAMHALIRNSLEALGDGGQVAVSVSLQTPGLQLIRGTETTSNRHRQGSQATQSWAQVVVADDGPGISPETGKRMFDPFFSGREAGRGLGFGLSKCWRIVDAHGGRLEVVSRAPYGAAMTIRLPIAAAGTLSEPLGNSGRQ